MPKKPEIDELREQLKNHIDYFGGTLPERNTIAWSGYLTSLVEYELLSLQEFSELVDMLPKLEDNPAATILFGPLGDYKENGA